MIRGGNMLFNSIQFLLFFPIVVLIFFLIPGRFQYIWLLVASYYFYMCWNAKYALLLLFSTVATYLSGYFLQKIRDSIEDETCRRRRMNMCVAICFVMNLGILFYFKYFNFALANVNRVLNLVHINVQVPLFDIVLPVGISFYTFQALSYTIDVYRGEIRAEKNFLRYALFVSFFPQLVAGPIERSKNLLWQLREEHKFDYDNFRDGIYLMLWGYFLKLVLADRIALFVDKVYGNYEWYNGVYLIVATILFAFQIYCDFAGYSTIAIGAAKIMGFELMENFNAPYLASNVADFWRRWHISLSSWFRDYLYIPLGGNRKGTARKYFNLLVVFAVSGLWHGANWTFVIWGTLNAVYQIIGSIYKKIKKAAGLCKDRVEHISDRVLKIVATFVLVDFSWIFFRAQDLHEAVQIIKSMITSHNWWILFDDSLTCLVITRKNFMVMMFGIFVLLAADILKYKGICVRKQIMQQAFWFRYCVIVGAVWFIMVFGIWGPSYNAANFIYFQF